METVMKTGPSTQDTALRRMRRSILSLLGVAWWASGTARCVAVSMHPKIREKARRRPGTREEVNWARIPKAQQLSYYARLVDISCLRERTQVSTTNPQPVPRRKARTVASIFDRFTRSDDAELPSPITGSCLYDYELASGIFIP